MKHDSSKQDLSIAQQLPLHLHTNPQKSKINLFIAESFKNLQIVEQTYHRSYGSRHQPIQKEPINENAQLLQTKRKASQRSDSYHRVTNSRKIKTKRTTKQNLPRSDYFYFQSIAQQNQQSPIIKLVNDYESFHQMIVNNDFFAIQKTIIRLSHYGNKKKDSKSRDKSLGRAEIYHTQSCYYKGGINCHSEERKLLSKSAVVPEVDMKRSVVLTSSNEERFVQQSKHKQTYAPSNKKQLLPNKQALSKYTTPIRTIYLNKSQQSPQYLHSHSSSVNKLSISTPLRNNKPYLQQQINPSSILRHNNTNDSKLQNESSGAKVNGRMSLRESERRYDRNSGYKDKNNNCSFNININSNNRPKLCVVSSQKKWSTLNQLENVQMPLFVKSNLVYVPKHQYKLDNVNNQNAIDQTVPNQNFSLKANHLHTTAQLLHSNRQNHSRSDSRKGLSLTQSASQINSKNKSPHISSKSITKLNHNNIQRQKDIIARKLDQKGLLQSKRVQIRIY